MIAPAHPSSHRLADDALHRMGWLTGVAVYAVLLQAGYVLVVEPSFSYMGYQIHSRDPLLALLGTLLALLPAVLAPARLDRPSAVVAWMLFFIVHVPTVTIPFWSLADAARYLPYALMQTAVFSLLMTVPAWPRWTPAAGRRLPVLSSGLRALLIAGPVLVLLAMVVAGFGLRMPDLSLAYAYEARGEFAEQAAGTGRLATYAVGWLGLVAVPMLIAGGLAWRRPLLLVPALLLQVYLFGLTGYKSLFFAVFLAIGAWFLVHSGRRWALLLSWAVAGMVLAAAGWSTATGDLVPMSMFIRRLLVTPGLLTGAYFDFFALREPVLWSHSLFSDWVTYPLPEPYTTLISLRYLYGAEGSANVHFLTDAFVNLRYLGMLLVALIASGVLWLADSLAVRLPRGLASAVIVVPCSALANSALNTSLMTHGILLALLLLFLLGQGSRRPVA